MASYDAATNNVAFFVKFCVAKRRWSEFPLRRAFYLSFPIGHALRDELEWTYYRILMREDDPIARVVHERVRGGLMELGRGFSSVARQKHMRSGSDDYFIDLVFYNYILKCFFLIDLKMGKVTHKDVGQMDM